MTTLAADGARITQAGQPPVTVGAIPGVQAVDPTGAGDAFRAGFLAAVAWQLPLERAGQLGCLVAASALETVGTQEYQLTRATLTDRFAAAYGARSRQAKSPSTSANGRRHGRCTTAGYGESLVTGPASRASCPVSGRCVGELPPRGAERIRGARGVAPGRAQRRRRPVLDHVSCGFPLAWFP